MIWWHMQATTAIKYFKYAYIVFYVTKLNKFHRVICESTGIMSRD